MSESQKHMNTLLGQRIRKTRKARGMTQGDLAKEIGLTRASVVNIEKGRQALSVWNLCTIARALSVSSHVFLLDEGHEEPLLELRVMGIERIMDSLAQLDSEIQQTLDDIMASKLKKVEFMGVCLGRIMQHWIDAKYNIPGEVFTSEYWIDPHKNEVCIQVFFEPEEKSELEESND